MRLLVLVFVIVSAEAANETRGKSNSKYLMISVDNVKLVMMGK